MSWEATTWAVKQTPKNAAQKLVLILLANHTNGQTGQCNPSHRILARECCMSSSTLKVHIENLAEAGLIKIHRRFREGQQLPNQYFLQMAAEAQIDPEKMDSEGVVSVFDGGSRNPATPSRVLPPPSPQNSATEPGSKPGIETRDTGKPVTLSVQDLVAEGVEQQVAADWLANRKLHKAPLTPTAWAGVKAQAEKAGLTPAAAVKLSAENGWRGFKAEWVQNRSQQSGFSPPAADPFAGAH